MFECQGYASSCFTERFTPIPVQPVKTKRNVGVPEILTLDTGTCIDHAANLKPHVSILVTFTPSTPSLF